jgi:dTDP-4-dehydrorhamnose reductase
MTVNKILLFGASGMLGRYLKSYFSSSTKVTLTVADYRVTEESIDLIYDYLVANGVDSETCVINCIGAIPQRRPPKDRDYYLVNGLFPHVLSAAVARCGAQIIHPTTDCVFSGAHGNYNEDSVPDETNAYGVSKSLGEPHNATVIRTSIIGEELANKKSFLEWVLSNRESLNGYSEHMWNGLTCLEVCRVIDKIITMNLFWNGVRHFYSPTSKSKYELASMIVQIYETGAAVTPLKTERVDKTLISKYELCKTFDVPELYVQLKAQKEFKLLE